jgi:flagellin
LSGKNLEKEKKTMAINDVSLTSGMRANLISLQGTVDLLNKTQQRLSTGKKVNSALDDPTSYFASTSLNSLASDLSSRKDQMSNAVQVIDAANNGITGITALIESAKGIANSALSSNNTTTVYSLGQQYDSIMAQIDKLATDSGYNGTNLLAVNSLTVSFSSSNSLSVTSAIAGSAVNFTNLGLTTSTVATQGSAWSVVGGANVTTASITAAITALGTAETQLQDASGVLSANLSVINTRQTFTTSMINTLQTGADNLTLADTNEEGAKMLMLQTRQSLGTTALSLSSQAAQSVLKLFS